jgi:cyclase
VLSKRLIPVFLLRGGRLVKGTRFQHHVDVGDPISQAMIYDAQGADELVIVDIDATREGRTIPTDVVNAMIVRCRLPIAAGGGIRSVEDARACFRAGADRLVVNSAAVARPGLVRELSDEFGSQSVLVSLDVRRIGDGWTVFTESGTREAGDILECAADMVAEGAGEIMLTSIDHEGMLQGYDVELYEHVRSVVQVPLIAAGGPGSYDHIVELLKRTDSDAAGVGKMLFLRDYDMVRIKSYVHGRRVLVREA